MTNAAATTRRIRKRASQFQSFKGEALARQAGVTVAGAVADAATKGKTVADVREVLVAQLGECWRNLASRKREVRRLPHMRKYHTEYALAEMALIRMGTHMLSQIDTASYGVSAT
jgi:hypothetical protein